MRRLTLTLSAMAVMVSLFAVAAYAASIDGTNLDDFLKESQREDVIDGHEGDDRINANVFSLNETPRGLGDEDIVNGNSGEDFINVKDGDPDDIADGGPNADICRADPGDDVIDCE
jgi:Ca2+-binding RTX toxin-like protein